MPSLTLLRNYRCFFHDHAGPRIGGKLLKSESVPAKKLPVPLNYSNLTGCW